jgi:hypothetical protein
MKTPTPSLHQPTCRCTGWRLEDAERIANSVLQLARRRGVTALQKNRLRETPLAPPRSGLIFSYVLKRVPGCYRLDREKGRKMSKLKLLYGESNEEVLASQAAELQNAGYSVHTAIGRKAVQELLKKESFDLVVLGQTLSRDDRHHLPYMVKKAQAAAKVLVLHTDGSRHPYVDGNIDTGSDMQHFLDKISAMFQQSKPQPRTQSKTMAATSGR